MAVGDRGGDGLEGIGSLQRPRRPSKGNLFLEGTPWLCCMAKNPEEERVDQKSGQQVMLMCLSVKK